MWKVPMLWSGTVTCGMCAVPVPPGQAKRTLERDVAAVCRTCFDRWSRAGRICAKCRMPVTRPQQSALFVAQHALGHAACGGALLAAERERRFVLRLVPRTESLDRSGGAAE